MGDFVGHAYLGENAAAAAFLGRHYLGWALLGQAHFAVRVAANFPQELVVARQCLAARSANASADDAAKAGYFGFAATLVWAALGICSNSPRHACAQGSSIQPAIGWA